MTLLDLIQDIPDPRMQGKITHKLSTLLFVGLCGVLSGCESWSDIEYYCEIKYDWLCQYVDLTHGVPSEWTFRRIFTLLDPLHIENLLRRHASALINKSEKESHHVSIDGKALKGSKRLNLKCLYSVSAWCEDNNIVLAEQQVGQKSNEIQAIPLLLDSLDIKGKTISIDAAGCQKTIAKLIKDKKGHYVVGLKKNHPTLYQAAVKLKEKEGEKEVYRLEDYFDESHGRLTRRRYFTYDASSLPDIEKWAGASSLVAVETITSNKNDPKGEISAMWRYYLTSHKRDHVNLPTYIRRHWGIESKLHWVLDVAMGEDNDQKAERKSARSFSLLRRIALNIIRTKDTTPKRSVKRKLKRSGWDNEYLKNLLLSI